MLPPDSSRRHFLRSSHAIEQMNRVPPTNLRPYGTPAVGTLEHPTWPHEYRAQAFARAQNKLAMASLDVPLNRDPRLALTLAFNLSFVLLLGALSVFAAVRDSGPPPVVVFIFVFVIGSVQAFQAWAESDGKTPKGALKTWVHAIRAQKWERVDRLRLAADRDSFPRIVPGEGPSGGALLETPDDVLRYWSELMSRNRLSRSQWLVSKVSSRPLAPDLMLVTFRLAVGRGSALIGLFVLIAISAILIASSALMPTDSSSMALFGSVPGVLIVVLVVALFLFSRRRKFELTKLVIRRNDRWRVFNGEWQGPEERDLAWIKRPVQEYPTDPAAFTR